MARIIFEYGKWDSVMGYQCSQCGTFFPFAEGALRHEEKIDDNGGVCPDARTSTEDKGEDRDE